jgi:protein-S-isoprenylcysteine O-methyltransferase Ste14
MLNLDRTTEQMRADLGWKRLSRTWAKWEILLGLAALGLGLLVLLLFATPNPNAVTPWTLIAGALVLFVLGGYLTLAGHRSHLYQSNTELTAYLLARLGLFSDKVERT